MVSSFVTRRVTRRVRTPMPIARDGGAAEAAWSFNKRLRQSRKTQYDMQDIPFKSSYMLQCRNGSVRLAQPLSTARDLATRGADDEKQAVLMIDPRNLDTLLHPPVRHRCPQRLRLRWARASALSGAACGKVIFTAEDAKEWASRRENRSCVGDQPRDIEGMRRRTGILTVRGSMTSTRRLSRAAWRLLRLRLRRDKDGRAQQGIRACGQNLSRGRLYLHRRLHR